MYNSMSRNLFITIVILAAVIAFLIVGFVWLRYGMPGGTFDRLQIFGGKKSGDGFFEGGVSFPQSRDQATPLPRLQTPRLIQLTREAVVGPATVRGEEKIKYFKRATGHLYQIDGEGRTPEERLSNLTIAGARDAVWSPNKNHAVVNFLTDSALKHFALSYLGTSSQGIFLPNEIIDAAFSQKDERMAYLLPTGTARTLFVASSDGSGQKNIFTTPLSQLNLSWAGDDISIAAKSSGLTPSFVQRVAINGSSRVIARDIDGLDVRWNAQGTLAVISRTSLRGKNLTIHIMNDKGKIIADLPFATIASKCAWSRLEEETAYCAVPRALPQATYPDAWWQGVVSFSDDLWRVNAATGEADQIFSGRDFDIINLFLSEAEDRLFFLDKKDSTLWTLRLEE